MCLVAFLPPGGPEMWGQPDAEIVDITPGVVVEFLVHPPMRGGDRRTATCLQTAGKKMLSAVSPARRRGRSALDRPGRAHRQRAQRAAPGPLPGLRAECGAPGGREPEDGGAPAGDLRRRALLRPVRAVLQSSGRPRGGAGKIRSI